MKIVSLIWLFLTAAVFAQENHWQPFLYFIGEWSGHETGRAGIGKGERSYEFVMDGAYLFAKNVSRFEPQEKNPRGEMHQDWSFISYDENRERFVLREFHSERFINQYILEPQMSSDSIFVFVSESSENAPPGLRARVTFRIKSANEFEETFEIAMPNKDFSEWLRNYWTRNK